MSTDLEPGAYVEVRPHTTRAHRLRAMVVYVCAFLIWTTLVGLPNDPIGIFLWLWAAGFAWNVDAPRSYHWRFPRDWWPVLLGLAIYYFTRGAADDIGLPVHVTMPIDFDTWLSDKFGGHGEIPTERLQHALCGDPCLRTSDPRWYDVLLTTVYASHFVTGLVLAAILWVTNRESWLRWMRRYLALNYAALAIYFIYPMAPPWMASRDGDLPAMSRITTRGWADIGLDRTNMVLLGLGNKVAAMPSLHAGVAFLIAFYGIWRLQSRWRFLLLLYPLAMCTALVYFAEHYIIDELAGGLLAGLVMVACALWERRRPYRLKTT